LAISGVIHQVSFGSEYRAAGETLKINHFSVFVTEIAVFGTINSTCVVYTKTIIIIHLRVGE